MSASVYQVHLERILTSCSVSMGLKVQRQNAKRGVPAMQFKCIEWLVWALPFHHVLTPDLVAWRTREARRGQARPGEPARNQIKIFVDAPRTYLFRGPISLRFDQPIVISTFSPSLSSLLFFPLPLVLAIQRFPLKTNRTPITWLLLPDRFQQNTLTNTT